MNYSSALHNFQEIVVNIFIAVSWLLIILTFIGVFTEYPQVFDKVAFYMKIYMCLFLIWRFNPIRHYLFHNKITFTELDRKIAFSAGLIILSTIVIKEYLVYMTSIPTKQSKKIID